MNRPLFALGKAQVRSLTTTAPAQGKQLAIANASTHYAVGDQLFIAESGGAEFEYLGAVAATQTNTLNVSIALRQAKSMGASVWRAAAFYIWPMLPARDREAEADSGVVVAQSLGGAIYSTRIADPRRIERLKFQTLPRADWDAFHTWMETHLAGGRAGFTWVDETGRVATARIIDPPKTLSLNDPTHGSTALTLALCGEGYL